MLRHSFQIQTLYVRPALYGAALSYTQAGELYTALVSLHQFQLFTEFQSRNCAVEPSAFAVRYFEPNFLILKIAKLDHHVPGAHVCASDAHSAALHQTGNSPVGKVER